MTLRVIPSPVRGVVLLLVAIVAAFSALASVHGQGQALSLGIKPSGVDGNYFTLTMTPGETRELTVELGNFGEAQARVRTYAADAYTIINGGFGAKLDGEPVSGVTRWVDYPADTIELPARTGIKRTFKVTVPGDAKPGQYITSLAIQNADPEVSSSGSVAMRQITRQVIAVAITVPGPAQPGVAIGAVTYRTVAGNSMIAVEIKNTGNTHLKLAGELVLRDASGAEVSRYPVTMDTFYAGMSTFVEVPFAGRINEGDYSVELSLADSEHKVQTAAPALALNVPPPADEGVPVPAGVVPEPAAINQPALGSSAGVAGNIRVVLIGVCLGGAGALTGVYIYRRQRRKHER